MCALARTRNVRIGEETYQELFKLKSLIQAMRGRNMTYDEMISEMLGLYQNLIKGTKVIKDDK